MIELAAIFLVSLIATLVVTPAVIKKLTLARITGKDMNKYDKPDIPNMGGFAVTCGFSAGILLAIGLSVYLGWGYDLKMLFGGFSVILLMSLIGAFDDLCFISQKVKAFLPFAASLPLVAVKAGVTHMNIPFVGEEVHFGILYLLILVPLGVTGAANATNMLAGFNGLEAGLGFVMMMFAGFWSAYYFHSLEAATILFAMAGALLAFLKFNWHPAKIFIGDIGTLSIGAALAVGVIIGNFEFFGMLLLGLYYLDFIIKALNKFPSRGWWGTADSNNNLSCLRKPVHLAQAAIKYLGIRREEQVVSFFIYLQVLIGMALTLVIHGRVG